jgi:glycosyltransferase involved in cell wall biosynthesis
VAERTLHIAIDGRELVGKPTGVGRYLHGMMTQWAAGSPHRYTVVVPAEPPPSARSLGERFTWIVMPADVAGTWWEQVHLPRALARTAPDVLFAPAYTAPLRRTPPVVVVVHDVSFFAHPEWFRWREGVRRRYVTRQTARRARTVITVSAFSQSEIERYLGVPADRIALAPAGAPVAEATAPTARPPLVLYVGSLFNRRHVLGMIQAFARIAPDVPSAKLVLVGDNRTSPRQDPLVIARECGVAGQVEWREYATDAELTDLYRTARVFLFLSDYEGFGIPPLEAFAHGVPAVVLDTPVSREVYGGGAIRVSSDPADIAAATRRLLTDAGAHAAAVTAGRARLPAYSWSRSAGVITRALEQAAR